MDSGCGNSQFSQYRIHAKIPFKEKNTSWYMIGRHLDSSKIKETGDLLSRLRTQSHQAWCVIGDFNKITSQYEKSGGKQRLEGQMVELEMFLRKTT